MPKEEKKRRVLTLIETPNLWRKKETTLNSMFQSNFLYSVFKPMATFAAVHCDSVEFLLPQCSQNLEQGITEWSTGYVGCINN